MPTVSGVSPIGVPYDSGASPAPTAVAKVRNTKISPKKLNDFARIIRKMHVNEALLQCEASPKKASRLVLEVSELTLLHPLVVRCLMHRVSSLGRTLCFRGPATHNAYPRFRAVAELHECAVGGLSIMSLCLDIHNRLGCM